MRGVLVLCRPLVLLHVLLREVGHRLEGVDGDEDGADVCLKRACGGQGQVDLRIYCCLGSSS